MQLYFKLYLTKKKCETGKQIEEYKPNLVELRKTAHFVITSYTNIYTSIKFKVEFFFMKVR